MSPSTPLTASEEAAHSAAVRQMFAAIAGRYDLLNHLLSLNIDRRWRRRVRAEIAEVLEIEGAIVLDVACGTGDLSIELARHARARVIGTDFCRPMIERARIKSSELQLPYVEADAMRLPVGDETFDAVTIAFGLRNLSDTTDGLRELYRVLKPHGKLVVLEFSSPIVPGFRQLFNFYFNSVLPAIGGLVSGSRSAYTYLPNSVSRFPDQKALASLLRETGFKNVSFRNLTGGVAAIHTGDKP